MLLSQYKSGHGIDPDTGLLVRIISFLRTSVLWLGGIVFAVLAAIGTFFFAMAAIIGTFILAAAIAFVWFLFKWIGGRNPTKSGSGSIHKAQDGTTILDAKRGPKGWTVRGRNPFDR